VQDLKSGFQKVDKKEIHLQGIKSIIFMGDVACTPFIEMNRAVLGKILEEETDLFLILGDISFLGEKEEFDEVIDFCDPQVSVPIFSLCGNHDIRGYSEVLGLSMYVLILDEFVVMALDNSRSFFQEDCLGFAEEMLEKYSDKRFLITFHVPPPTDLLGSCMRHEEWEKLKEVSDKYRDKIDCILTGHIHAFQEYYLDGYHIFISGGGGAALYNLEKDTLKSHHALKATFKDDATVEINVIPIEVEA